MMGIGSSRWTYRLVVLVALLALVLGAAACGSDDGDDKDSATAAAEQQSDKKSAENDADDAKAVKETGRKGEAQAAYMSFVDALYKRDAELVCSKMTAQAQRRMQPGTPCVKAMTGVVNIEFSSTKPYVVEVEKGKGGELTVWAKTPNSETYPIPFVEQDGEWKVNGGFGADAQPGRTRGEGKLDAPQS